MELGELQKLTPYTD